jgi:hypothetical protein
MSPRARSNGKLLARVGPKRLSILQVVQPVRRGHNLIDHGFRFCRDSVDHVICHSTAVIFVTDNSMVTVIEFL